jgi:hypothetical protein
MEPWTTAKSFEPKFSHSIETDPDFPKSAETSFATFRPRVSTFNVYETPSRISTQVSGSCDDLYDMPLESPDQICFAEKLPWQIAEV